MKRNRFFAVCAASLILLVTSAFQIEPPDWTNLGQVIVWLAGPGAAVAALALGAWANDFWPWWRDADQNVKNLITAVFASGLAIAAAFMPLAWIEAISPFWRIVVLVILALGTAGFGLYERRRGILAERARHKPFINDR